MSNGFRIIKQRDGLLSLRVCLDGHKPGDNLIACGSIDRIRDELLAMIAATYEPILEYTKKDGYRVLRETKEPDNKPDNGEMAL